MGRSGSDEGEMSRDSSKGRVRHGHALPVMTTGGEPSLVLHSGHFHITNAVKSP